MTIHNGGNFNTKHIKRLGGFLKNSFAFVTRKGGREKKKVRKTKEKQKKEQKDEQKENRKKNQGRMRKKGE